MPQVRSKTDKFLILGRSDRHIRVIVKHPINLHRERVPSGDVKGKMVLL
jgi:hypothetical protein